jgi:Ca2+/Na+ antiporter
MLLSISNNNKKPCSFFKGAFYQGGFMDGFKAIIGILMVIVAAWNLAIAYDLSRWVGYVVMVIALICVAKIYLFIKRKRDEEAQLQKEFKEEEEQKKKASNDA